MKITSLKHKENDSLNSIIDDVCFSLLCTDADRRILDLDPGLSEVYKRLVLPLYS